MTPIDENQSFAQLFRSSAPYINAFRGRCFVILISGETLSDQGFPHLIHDLALLNTLGIRLVLVHGARPQIDNCLTERGLAAQTSNEYRVTDSASLDCVKAVVGSIRLDIEAQLCMGLPNSPMAGARLRISGGNLVTAKPYGIRDGIDFQHTGEVRRIDTQAIQTRFEHGDIVLLSPIGYSPTGEIFNLNATDLACACASAIRAEKLIFLMDNTQLNDEQGQPIRELSIAQCTQLLQQQENINRHFARRLRKAMQVCDQGVRRAHIINGRDDGALLKELFTRDGTGIMISADPYEGTRQATIEDVGGLLELIAPLEAEGVLVKRSRERLEMEIGHFTLVERDGMIIACAALYPYPENQAGELACLAVHQNYRGSGRGDALLSYLENKAKGAGLTQLFVLSTRTAHWFLERGFQQIDAEALPMQRKKLYNYQRNSKVFTKTL